MTVVFRADSNAGNGEGHMMRCIAIAKEVRRRGEEAVFVTADGNPSELIKREGFRHIVLGTDWRHTKKEAAVLLPVLETAGADCLLVDSYYIAPGYFKPFKGLVRTAYMDDFGKKKYSADIVINYNIYARSVPYERKYRSSGTKLLLGPMYTPLRDEFCSVKPKPVSRVRDIMITTGSSDPYNVSGRLAKRLSRDEYFKDIRVHLVAGRYYENIPELKKISEDSPGITVCENVSRMSELMSRCDIAVSAGGTTVYELCACGVPSVIFSFADNQTKVRESFGETGAAVDCGDYRRRKEKCLDDIINAIKALENKETRKQLRSNTMGLTDGRGAVRLAACLAGR